MHQNGTKKGQRPLKRKAKDVTGYNKRVFITQDYFTHDYLRYAPIVLVVNIIITLNAINYFTKTFITDIWQDRKSDSTFWKKKNITFNLNELSTNIRAFSLTFWVFWAFWNDKRKLEKQQKNEICNRNADLPWWWQRICWKTLFQLCSSKVETKN